MTLQGFFVLYLSRPIRQLRSDALVFLLIAQTAFETMRVFFVVIALLSLGKIHAQCVWTNQFSESYEYTTVVPYIVPGSVYHNTPQTFAGCIHSGGRGLYMNIVDGYSGLLYDQTVNNLCTSMQYRFSFWTRDAWSGVNNLTVQVLDVPSNTVLSTINVINNSVWTNVVMPAFTPLTPSIRFRISTNTAGGPGNDVGFDDLSFEACMPQPYNTTLTQCSSASNFNLYPSISGVGFSTSGTWTGPTGLQNGYLGTFTPGTNTAGTYTYTVQRAAGCPDSVANVLVQLTSAPSINPLGPISACTAYTLPAITGSGLAGNEHYYTGMNGTGTMLATGSQVTTSQTIYIYGGSAGCNDQETVLITISQPGTAGNDNGAYYCGPGPSLTLSNYLSAGATPGGTWAETTASGTFNTATSGWNTNSLNPGTYQFTYTVPANGACPSDQANFTFTLGNINNVDLGNDTTLCNGQNLLLSPGAYDSYLWNNGSTVGSQLVTQPGGTYWVRVGTLGNNQIINGDFEQGNTGFSTDYTGGVGGLWGLLSNPGTYAVTTSPNLVHNNFNVCADHTPNPGQNQLVVNGASTANSDVWCQTVPVQPNTDYQFGTWVTSVVADPQVAQLQFMINGSQLGAVFSPTIQPCNWQQFAQNWNSGINTSAQICIVNQNTSGGGNDFALDDITFRPICFSSDTIVVSYSAPPVVNLGPDQSVCSGTPIILDAQNPGMNYQWSTNEQTQTTTPLTTGNYAVTVTNTFNCSASDNVNVLFETPLSAGADNADTICSTTANYPLTGLLSAGAAGNGSWESLSAAFGGILQNGTVSQLSALAGTFDFQYIVSGTFCPNDTAFFQLTIHEQPIAAADISLHVCNDLGNPVDFTGYLNHPAEPLPGSWEIPGTLPGGSFNGATNVFDPANVQQGSYEWLYILPAETGCVPDTTSITVDVTEMPQIQFAANITEGCQPLAIQLTNQSIVSGNTTYQWNLGDGTTSTSSTTVDIVYETAQCYDITLTATSDGLCTSSLTLPDLICVYPVPLASFYFGPQQVYSDGPTVDFTNTSIDHDFSFWDFGDGAISSSENPQHTYPEGDIGNYEAQLIVTTQFGCSDTTSHIIVIKDQLLYYVPNTFTPDDDEFNQQFVPVFTSGFDPNDYNLQIFNRWGEIVFESNDYQVGWDGTYHGRIVPEGIYTWKIRFGMMDTDEVKVLAGHVLLIR